MLETKDFEINGVKYVYQPLMLKPARALFDKIVQRFGPALAKAIERLQDAKLDETMPLEQALGNIASSAGGLVDGIVKGLDQKTHEELADTIAKQTMVDTEGNGNLVPLTEVRELLFGNSLLTEFKVIRFALEVQYGDFLEPLRNLGQYALAFRAKAESPSNLRKELTGISTESQRASDTATV